MNPSIPHPSPGRACRPARRRDGVGRRPLAGTDADDRLKGKAGNLDHLALDAKGQRLFLANKANNTLDIIDLKAGQVLKQIPGQNAVQGVAYAAGAGPDLRRPGHGRPVQRLQRRELQDR